VQRERAIDWGAEYARAQGLADAQVSAQPRPVSPFNWLVIVRSDDEVRYSFVNLVREEARALAPDAGFIARLDAAYLPRREAQWVHASAFGTSEADRVVARTAWSQPRFAFFRWFADEPVLIRVERGNPSTCAWFQDLRFFTPGRATWPFRYGMCREGEGPWVLYALEGNDRRVPVR